MRILFLLFEKTSSDIKARMWRTNRSRKSEFKLRIGIYWKYGGKKSKYCRIIKKNTSDHQKDAEWLTYTLLWGRLLHQNCNTKHPFENWHNQLDTVTFLSFSELPRSFHLQRLSHLQLCLWCHLHRTDVCCLQDHLKHTVDLLDFHFILWLVRIGQWHSFYHLSRGTTINVIRLHTFSFTKTH